MSEHSPTNIGLADVDREIAARKRWLQFAPAVETMFASETKDAKLAAMNVKTATGVILYDSFLINDWLALHDRFFEMFVARVMIFTPLMLGLLALSVRRRSIQATEWATALGVALAVLLPMTAMIYSHSTHKLSYQYGSFLVMMFATVVQRIRFRPAVVAVCLVMAIQLTATYVSRAFDTETYVAIVSFFVSAAALQLIAMYTMEGAERHSYLFALRGRILHDQLVLSAQTDALTGLFNRRHLSDVKTALWANSELRCVSAILLDIDHFKLFNDSRGHLEGDDCLTTISHCIRDAIAGGPGTAFRFGGEEMLILLPGIDPHEAYAVADRVRHNILAAAIPHPATGDGAIVTASFGIAGVMPSTCSGSDLIAAADAALYAAKRAGRNAIWPPAAQGAPPRRVLEAPALTLA